MPRNKKGQSTTVALLKTTRDRLKNFGRKGQLYDEILNDLMDFKEQNSESSRKGG